MKAFAVLAGVVASAAAQWPAGVHPTACPNYPFCGEAIAPAAPAVIPAVSFITFAAVSAPNTAFH